MSRIRNIKELYKSFHEQYHGKSNLNPMSAPRLGYIALSVGCGKHHKDSARIDYIADEFSKIAGQQCVKTRAKKSISNFGIREGAVVGLQVTLRGDRMFSFLDRLIMIAIPRMQDFSGLSERSFDSNHNYNFGLERQDIFPESNANHLFGMNICLGILAKERKDAITLMKAIGLPFLEFGGAGEFGGSSAVK